MIVVVEKTVHLDLLHSNIYSTSAYVSVENARVNVKGLLPIFLMPWMQILGLQMMVLGPIMVLSPIVIL